MHAVDMEMIRATFEFFLPSLDSFVYLPSIEFGLPRPREIQRKGN